MANLTSVMKLDQNISQCFCVYYLQTKLPFFIEGTEDLLVNRNLPDHPDHLEEHSVRYLMG